MKNAVNLAMNLVGFVVTFGISFFLSPYIVRTLGVEANGLIGLTTNFLNYASVLTIVLSSMAARFITVELKLKHPDAANEFYTAAYAGHLLGVLVLLPIMAVTILNFGSWFNVPAHLVHDAQLLAAMYFVHFLVALLVPLWPVGTWATNNLYLDSLRGMQSVLIRGGLILVFFLIFDPAVYFVGLATLVSGIFSLAFSGYYKHRFLPDLRVHAHSFRWARMRELWVAGFWNTVNYLGGVLSTGFHLLLAGVFLGATPMGLLGLAMTVPAMVNQLGMNLTTVFQPNLAFAFADNDTELMKQQVVRAMSVTSLLTMMPLATLIVFGETFFALWVPTEDARLLDWMSIATAAGLGLSVLTQPLQNIFVITNSQRRHSLASLVMGVLNVTLALALLLTTDLGVFAILLAAIISTSGRALIFTVPMAGRRVGGNAWALLPEVLRGLGYLAVLVLIGLMIHTIHAPTSWLGFIGSVAAMCILGGLVNTAILTSRSDRQMIVSVARRLWPSRR